MKEIPQAEKERSRKILEGIHKAYRRLLEETAARNGNLVIERNGKVARVSAKELLLIAQKKK